jgi:hypothetical protein
MQISEVVKNDRQNNITIYGSERNIRVFNKIPDWSNEEETAFRYRGNIYFISEFTKIDKTCPDWMQKYDGYSIETVFSGILIKLNKENSDYIKAYMYTC